MLVDAVDDEGLHFLYLSVPVLKTGLGVLIQVLLQSWTKRLRKRTLPSVLTSKQSNDHIFPAPLPPTQCCLVGHEQFHGNQHFPNQHCIGGGGEGEGTCRNSRGGIGNNCFW